MCRKKTVANLEAAQNVPSLFFCIQNMVPRRWEYAAFQGRFTITEACVP